MAELDDCATERAQAIYFRAARSFNCVILSGSRNDSDRRHLLLALQGAHL
jgi:hypothetical protein